MILLVLVAVVACLGVLIWCIASAAKVLSGDTKAEKITGALSLIFGIGVITAFVVQLVS